MHFSNCFEISVTKYSLAFKYNTHKLKTNNELAENSYSAIAASKGKADLANM
jgi:hypothetical protein